MDIKKVIKNIRKGIDFDESLQYFFSHVNENIDNICENYNLRWLISIIDTYIDHGNSLEKSEALMVSVFANIIKLSDHYIKSHHESPEKDPGSWELYPNEEVTIFNVTGGDMSQVLFYRINKTLKSPIIIKLWKAILEKEKKNSYLLNFFEKKHEYGFYEPIYFRDRKSYENTKEKNNRELEKYKWLRDNKGESYGSTNQGANYIDDYIKTLNYETLLDLGTGDGTFCNMVSPYFNKVYGVDFVLKFNKNTPENVNLIECDAISIPLDDKSVDITTSFDFMEHLIEEHVDLAIKEMVRITKYKLLHRISYRKSVSHKKELEKIFGNGELHQTVHNSNWWIDKFNKYGSVILSKEDTSESGLIIVDLK